MDPRVIQTVTEMMCDRGYTVKDDNGEILVCEKNNKSICAYFNTSPKFGIKHVNEIIADFEKNAYDLCLIIHEGTTSSFVKSAMVDKPNVQLFPSQTLLTNVTHHDLVPKHILLSPNDKNNVLQMYRITERNMPLILSSDPISRYYGAKPGDMFKIIRKSDSSGTYMTYRLCV